MEQYILKSALVAWAKETYLCENASMIRRVCYKQLLEHLDTLEVKEVDLEKEIRRYRMNNPIIGHREESLYDYMTNIAKHFFELGMQISNKAQKGESV